jgi:two-component system NtrC family sensor kinase
LPRRLSPWAIRWMSKTDLNTELIQDPRSNEVHESLDRHVHVRGIESARQALLSRPRYSVRLHIFLGFFLVFLFAAAIAAVLIVTTYQVENKLRFLEIVNDYVLEIQQARRFEKNFFLYGTNLSDALENIYQAKNILERNSKDLSKILGRSSNASILPGIQRYEELLKQLTKMAEAKTDGLDPSGDRKMIELELRKHGQEIVSIAQELMRKERESLEGSISLSRHLHIYSLVFLLAFIALNAYLLGGRILQAINRFMVYAERIAVGDYTPITPARRYRDEFTDLAVAINHMMQELESREAVLIQSHKLRAIGTLTAGVAHELNNPLNNITLTAHMLMEDYEKLSDGERKEMIGDVIGEAARSRNIISNLLDFARESGTHLEPLDLARLLQETIGLAQNQIKLSGIKIDLHAIEKLPRIHGDSQQLKQVFLNLILNAVDASRKGGKIQVLVLPADEPNYVAVKVIDFGSGIPPHVLGSIFDPFFTTKSKGKGTGLGLSVSQGIVAKHGGRIMMHSVEGKGSTFTVTLPITTIPADIPPAAHPRASEQ